MSNQSEFSKLVDGQVYKISYDDMFVMAMTYTCWVKVFDGHLITTGDDFEVVYYKHDNNFKLNSKEHLDSWLWGKLGEFSIITNEQKAIMRGYVDLVQVVIGEYY